MAEKKDGSLAVVVATILLAFFFLYIGYITLAGETARLQFAKWGYPDWVRTSVGVLEIAAAVLLLLPQTSWIAATTLAAMMIAASATLAYHEKRYAAAMPVLLFISLSSLAYYRFPRKASPAGPAHH
jgi:uncharacterized membrane protein YphA (DoxX/SURF4 family)